MLIEFEASNFRSIKEKVLFSMVASKDDSHPESLIKKQLNGDSILKSAVIYGANASGKSNLMIAMGFLTLLVRNSHLHQKGEFIRYEPFKLELKYLKEPTTFRVVFIKNKVRYQYLVSFNAKGIIEESLYHYPKNKKALLFERKRKNVMRFYLITDPHKYLTRIPMTMAATITVTIKGNFPENLLEAVMLSVAA